MSKVDVRKRGWAIRKYLKGEAVKIITYRFAISQPTLWRTLKKRGLPIRRRKGIKHEHSTD